jgi:hypothetical protein
VARRIKLIVKSNDLIRNLTRDLISRGTLELMYGIFNEYLAPNW